MITSPDNEKLKLVRKLGQKKHREKLGLFVTEGEDLADAGLAAGHEPQGAAGPPGLRKSKAKKSSRNCWNGPHRSLRARR